MKKSAYTEYASSQLIRCVSFMVRREISQQGYMIDHDRSNIYPLPSQYHIWAHRTGRCRIHIRREKQSARQNHRARRLSRILAENVTILIRQPNSGPRCKYEAASLQFAFPTSIEADDDTPGRFVGQRFSFLFGF